MKKEIKERRREKYREIMKWMGRQRREFARNCRDNGICFLFDEVFPLLYPEKMRFIKEYHGQMPENTKTKPKTFLEKTMEEFDELKCPQCRIWLSKCVEIKSFLRQKLIEAVEMVGLEKIDESKDLIPLDFVDIKKDQASVGYNQAISDLKEQKAEIIKSLKEK